MAFIGLINSKLIRYSTIYSTCITNFIIFKDNIIEIQFKNPVVNSDGYSSVRIFVELLICTTLNFTIKRNILSYIFVGIQEIS